MQISGFISLHRIFNTVFFMISNVVMAGCRLGSFDYDEFRNFMNISLALLPIFVKLEGMFVSFMFCICSARVRAALVRA